jgi:hypothetical protein
MTFKVWDGLGGDIAEQNGSFSHVSHCVTVAEAGNPLQISNLKFRLWPSGRHFKSPSNRHDRSDDKLGCRNRWEALPTGEVQSEFLAENLKEQRKVCHPLPRRG